MERVLQQLACPLVVAILKRTTTSAKEPAEAHDVKLVGRQREPVPTDMGLDLGRRPSDHPTKTTDVRLQSSRRTRRWSPVPRLLDKSIGAHNLIEMQKEHGQHSALPAATQTHWATVNGHLYCT